MGTKPPTRIVDDQEDSPINSALRRFEATEANLAKLERLSSEIQKLIPEGIQFGSDPAYEEKVRAFLDVLDAVPKIDGWKPTAIPIDIDAIGQSRLDAKEVGEISCAVAVENFIEAPGCELADYRHRLNKKRRQLIRTVVSYLIHAVDKTLLALNGIIPKEREPGREVNSPHWERLKSQIKEIETLLADALPRPSRWINLRRHLHFSMMNDLAGIIHLDWPQIKLGLARGLYGPDEPLPVDVEDLGTLAAAQPKGRVVTKLKWETLTDEDFERLVFSLISSAPGYENPEWLTRTNAPDRGRDLSVIRVVNDALSTAARNRVVIQCKHWKVRSVSPSDIATLKEQLERGSHQKSISS